MNKLTLPDSYIECFKHLQEVSHQNGMGYMLVGAVARDIKWTKRMRQNLVMMYEKSAASPATTL